VPGQAAGFSRAGANNASARLGGEGMADLSSLIQSQTRIRSTKSMNQSISVKAVALRCHPLEKRLFGFLASQRHLFSVKGSNLAYTFCRDFAHDVDEDYEHP